MQANVGQRVRSKRGKRLGHAVYKRLDPDKSDVRLRARISRTWPSSTSAVITTAVSKYGSTTPCTRKPSGKICGAIVATTL